jgi:hypothetical protein
MEAKRVRDTREIWTGWQRLWLAPAPQTPRPRRYRVAPTRTHVSPQRGGTVCSQDDCGEYRRDGESTRSHATGTSSAA